MTREAAMRNRILTVGLGLSLSVLLRGPIQAEEPSPDPDPGEACRAFSFLWRLPRVLAPAPRLSLPMAAPLRLARDSARSLGHPPKHAGCADGPHQRGRPRIGLRLAAAR